MAWLLLLLACADRAPAEAPLVSSAAASPAVPAVPAVRAASPSPAVPRLAEPPGFQAIGGSPGPIYVTLSLNVNDYTRAPREAQAVRRYLESTALAGIDPVEVSFTAEALDALLDADPALGALLKARRPTVNEHYRLLQWRRLQDTEHELFHTDPSTLAVDRTRPGPVVRMQQVIGVTPRDEGGAPAELLRRRWVRASGTAALIAAGVSKVDKGALLAHPDRLVAAALASVDAQPGHRFVDGYHAAYRQMGRVRAGEKTSSSPAELDERLDDLARWAHVGKLMGVDVGSAPSVTALVDPARLGAFLVEPEVWAASAAEHAALNARDPAAAAAALDTAFAQLCTWTCAYADPAAELAARLDALDPARAWAGRLSWHATDDYTVGIWSEPLTGPPKDRPRAAETRSDAEQALVAASYDAVIAVLRANPRVRFVSLDNDTQWAADNAPAAGWKSAFGLDLAALPGAVDVETVDAAAEAEGIRVRAPERATRRPPRGR